MWDCRKPMRFCERRWDRRTDDWDEEEKEEEEYMWDCRKPSWDWGTDNRDEEEEEDCRKPICEHWWDRRTDNRDEEEEEDHMWGWREPGGDWPEVEEEEEDHMWGWRKPGGDRPEEEEDNMWGWRKPGGDRPEEEGTRRMYHISGCHQVGIEQDTQHWRTRPWGYYLPRISVRKAKVESPSGHRGQLHCKQFHPIKTRRFETCHQDATTVPTCKL